MKTSKHTPLYDLHQQLAAKMTEFAGYQMPLQYKDGIIREHLHCRTHAGFFDISHMGQLWLTGQNIALELEKLTPSNISALNIGQQQYTILTNKNGGVVDDIIITRFDDGFLLVINAACKDKDLTHLKAYLSADCLIEPLNE
ncbi:MAG: glycine cleavage system aminomethyltransferase GcvT, partial [Methylococcaceae bacterium]|nr:glycine cleavage system aminomethyltransferase GcvT [Methylococcaceae bacterium]